MTHPDEATADRTTVWIIMILFLLGAAVILGGVIGTIKAWPRHYYNDDAMSYLIALLPLTSGIVSGVLFFGLAKIIDLLDGIYWSLQQRR